MSKKKKQVLYVTISVFSLLLFALLLFLFVIAGVSYLETYQLFQPTRTKDYRSLGFSGLNNEDVSKWIDLPSGGGLLHMTPQINTKKHRTLLFLHGNSMSLNEYVMPLQSLVEMGYNVYALEYGGYGMTKRTKRPDCFSVEQDVLEAYQVCGNGECIVAGFSLGGAILGQVYDLLSPSPAQIVFLNTFSDTSLLIKTVIGPRLGPFLHSFCKTQWKTRSPSNPSNFKTNVLIVYTKDDEIIPVNQNQLLCRIFSKYGSTCIELPTGGHRNSLFIHEKLWIHNLLSSYI